MDKVNIYFERRINGEVGFMASNIPSMEHLIMTELDKLRATLCTVEKVSKDVMELRFGCKVKIWSTPEYEGCINVPNGEIYKLTDTECFNFAGDELWIYEEGEYRFEIIGNQLQQRHLSMYCEEKGIRHFLSVGQSGTFLQDTEKEDDMGEDIPYSDICKIDNDKDLEDQDEKTLGAINTFLTQTND